MAYNVNKLASQIMSSVGHLFGGKKGGDPIGKLEDALQDNTKAIRDLADSTDDMVKQFRTRTRKGAGGMPEGAADAGKKAGEEWGQNFSERASKAVLKGGFWASISYGLQRVVQDFDPIHLAFRGLVTQEISFMRNMRAIGYETQGITSATQSLQEAWQDMGKTVSITGQSLGTMQQELVKNMRKGVTTQKEIVAVTRTGLHVATMIGDQSNQIAGTFADWHRTLQIDTLQMAQMGRDVQLIARETGVTGEHLAAAVKSSEKLLKNMRDSATFTAAGAKSMMELTTRFEKAGIGDIGGSFAEMISSTQGFFQGMQGPQGGLIASLAAQAGVLDQMRSGSFKDSATNFKALAAAMDDFMKANSGFSFANVEKMPDQLKEAMNIMFKNLGMGGVGAAKVFWEQIQQQGLTMGDRIAQINKELNTQNLTMEERTHLLKRVDDLQMAEGFRLLTQFTDAAKAAGDINTAFQKLSTGDGPKSIDDLQNAAMMTANALKKAGGKDFTSAISSAMGTGDIVKMRTVIEDMSKEQQKVAVDEKKSLDPLSKMGQWFNELNESIRDVSRNIITSSAAIGTAIVVANAGALAARGMAGWSMIEGLFGKGRGLFGRGAAPTGGGAGGVGGVGPGGLPTLTPPALTGTGPAVPTIPGGPAVAGPIAPVPPTAAGAPAAAGGGGGAMGSLLNAGTSAMRGMGGQLVDFAKTLGVAAGVIAMVGGAIVLANKLLGPGLGLDEGQVIQTVKMMGIILGAAGMIAGAVTAMTYTTALLGAAFSGPWAAVLVPALAAGAVALGVLTPIIIGLGVAMMKLFEGIAGMIHVDEAQAEKATKQIKMIVGLAGGIGEVLSSASGLVYKFVRNSWWNFWSEIPLEGFRKGRGGLVSFVREVNEMLTGPGGIVEALSQFNVTEPEMKTVAQKIGLVSYLMNEVGGIMGTVNERMLMIKDKQAMTTLSDKNKMTLMTGAMTLYFRNILRFVRVGVFEPLLYEFQFSRDELKEVSFRATAVAALLTSTVKILDTLNRAFATAEGSGGDTKKALGVVAELANKKADYAAMFGKVSEFLQGGILKQLQSLPAMEDLATRTKQMQSVANIVAAVQTTMKRLAEMGESTPSGMFSSGVPSLFEKVAALDPRKISTAVKVMQDGILAASKNIDSAALEQARQNFLNMALAVDQLGRALSRYQDVSSAASSVKPMNVPAVSGAGSPPKLAEGGLITRSGLSVVHAGEYVVPADYSPASQETVDAHLLPPDTDEQAGANWRATEAVADNSVYFGAIADHTSALPGMAMSMSSMAEMLEWQKRYYEKNDRKVRSSPAPGTAARTSVALNQTQVPRPMWRLGTQVTGTEPPGGGHSV